MTKTALYLRISSNQQDDVMIRTIASGVIASIICCFQFLTTGYLARLLDGIEKSVGIAANGNDKKTANEK